MNRFLAGVPDAERERIFRLTPEITDRLAEWAAPYGIFETVRFPAVAISMAAASPWLDVPRLTEAAMIPAWIYAIDDAYDRTIIAPADRSQRVRRYTQVAAGRGGRWHDDPYAASLGDLSARLARRRLWPDLRAEWSASCRRMLTGMAFECDTADRVRAGAEPPSFREYMNHGLHSIGVPMYLAGAWILDDDPGTMPAIAGLRRLARASGRAVRLANDLRTHDKECGEGNFNALMLLSRGVDSPRAAAAVRGRLGAYMRQVVRVGGSLPGLSPATLTVRVTCFSVDFYAEYDYHTVPHEQILRRAAGH